MTLTVETLNGFEQSLVNNNSNLVKFIITITQTQIDEATTRISWSSTATINQLNTLMASGKTPVFIINSHLNSAVEYYYSVLFIGFIDSEAFRLEFISGDLNYLSAVDADSPLSRSYDRSIEGGANLA